MIDLLDPRSVPLWTAFFAGVVSVVGLIIAKEHRVSDFRQAWIDALRGEIAALIGRANAINEWVWAIAERNAKAADSDGGKRSATVGAMAADEYTRAHEDVVKMEEALATIELRLNPKDDEAKVLVEKAEAVAKLVRFYKPVCRNALKAAEKQLLDESKSYLKREWETVKRGEPRHRWAVWTSFTIAAIGATALAAGFAGWLMAELGSAAPATGAAPQVQEASAGATGAEAEGEPAGTDAGGERQPGLRRAEREVAPEDL